MAHHQGMAPRRARQRPQRRGDGRPLPRRSDRPGDGAPAPGADAARRARRPTAGRGGRRARPTSATSCRPVLRRFTSPHDAIPRTHLLSNGRYAVMVTAAGSGLQPLGRHRGDPLARGRDPRLVGQLPVPARHGARGAVWSAGHQPSGAEADSYEVDLLGGPRRVLPARRLDRHPPDDRRVRRARRRDPAGDADQPRLTAPARSS